MRVPKLVSKLGFLVRLLKKGDDDLGGSVVLSLCDDFGESCLFRECRELENEIVFSVLLGRVGRPTTKLLINSCCVWSPQNQRRDSASGRRGCT